jgi:hypothetical protein
MSFWPALGGFLLVPVVGTVATRVVHGILPRPATNEGNTNQALAIAGVAYVAAAVTAYSLSKRRGFSEGEKSFARGGMWGSALAATSVPIGYAADQALRNAAASVPIGYAADQALREQPPRVAGALTSSDVRGMLDTLTGGAITASSSGFAG